MADQTVPDGTLAAAAWYDNNVVVQALVAAAHERGVAAGRAQAAARIRAEAADEAKRPNRDRTSKAIEKWLRVAAHIAEGTETP